MSVNVSDIAVSLAGRDKGTYYVVAAVDGEYAYICDGKRKKADNLKKKKKKHLKVIGRCENNFDINLLGTAPLNKIIKQEIRNSIST